jgi:antitoxin component YwqK of YwqJK toxin-antitoxin module
MLFIIACSEEKKLERRVVMHPNNSVMKEWNIERTPKGDTLIQGPMKEFFWNGSPAASTIYIDGLKEGSSQAWYDNNSVKWQKVFAKDKPTGTWHLFTKDGKNWMEISFNEAGLRHGPAKVWDRIDRSKVLEAEFSNGDCTSGECEAFVNPSVAEDLPESAKLVLAKDVEVIRAFLE